jgi:hypothetical protein
VFQEGYLHVVIADPQVCCNSDPSTIFDQEFDFALDRPLYISLDLLALSDFDADNHPGVAGVFSAGWLGVATSQGGVPVSLKLAPEPSTFWLTGGVVAALLAFRRRRR